MTGLLRRLDMPLRYRILVLGGLLFLLASDGAVLLRGSNATPIIGLGTLLASFVGIACLMVAAWRQTAGTEEVASLEYMALRPNRVGTSLWILRWTVSAIHAPPLRTLFRVFILATSVALALDSVIAFVLGVALLLAPPSQAYPTDAISFAHAGATLVLSGADPYTSDPSFPAVLHAYPHTLATPLRGPVFGTSYDYPSDTRILAVQRRYLANPARVAGAFDPATLHSYPALSFLLYVPLLALGLSNVLILHLLVYAGLFVWLVRLAPPGLRRWAALAASTNAIVLGYAFLSDAQGICLALLLVAWHLRNRHWTAPILLGLACAYRQYCWFFVPFFLLAWVFAGKQMSEQNTDGERSALLRRALSPSLITFAAFLLPNLPYMVAAPGPWFASLWLPMTDPLFPNGMGFDALFTGHLLPYVSPLVFAIVELAALVGSVWAAVRWHSQLGDGVLLLALIPLLFAFRSLPNYFAVAPWIALYAINRIYAGRVTADDALERPAASVAPHLLPEATA